MKPSFQEAHKSSANRKQQTRDGRRKEPRPDQNPVPLCSATVPDGSNWVPPEENERLKSVS